LRTKEIVFKERFFPDMELVSVLELFLYRELLKAPKEL
jgi:hypothetical protein